ncbi:hypothetical protein ACHHYP_08093 [Achlya hypogyna]|uniref:Uncharacterized protein n=1 Tax=Achlya hypogyna TaxID=1202772 RepID=A0A1V9YPX4_ACHHY|nr:hypothetical protein ACHHYP_08093 [Achlya hypogyna]
MAIVAAAPCREPPRRLTRRRQCHNCRKLFVEYSDAACAEHSFARLTLLDDDVAPVYCSTDCRATATILHMQNAWVHAQFGDVAPLYAQPPPLVAPKPDRRYSSPRDIPRLSPTIITAGRDPDSVL